MSAWKYHGSPYLPDAANANRIERSSAVSRRLAARDEQERPSCSRAGPFDAVPEPPWADQQVMKAVEETSPSSLGWSGEVPR